MFLFTYLKYWFGKIDLVKEDGCMNIRIADNSDINLLSKKDIHISRQEIENLVFLKRVYIMETEGYFAGWLRYNLFWGNTPFKDMLYILEEYRAKGLGRKFVLFWEEQMKKYGYSVVMTSTVSNEYAQHLYYKLGYKAIGGFTPYNEPYEIILEKKLHL